MRLFRRPNHRVSLGTVQLQVLVADDDGPDALVESEPRPAEPIEPLSRLPAEVVHVPCAPPLAVRPVEDPEWVLHN